MIFDVKIKIFKFGNLENSWVERKVKSWQILTMGGCGKIEINAEGSSEVRGLGKNGGWIYSSSRRLVDVEVGFNEQFWSSLFLRGWRRRG